MRADRSGRSERLSELFTPRADAIEALMQGRWRRGVARSIDDLRSERPLAIGRYRPTRRRRH